MIELVGASLVTLAVVADIASYWKQIKKTLHTGKSRHVSTTAFMLRIAKDSMLVVALAIYKNWVGAGVHILAIIACSVTLIVVARHKPRGWKLWG